MKTRQSGFTLIELVVVIVILGIVGAVATARFQDLSGAANTAALSGVVGELSSAAAINYAASAVPGGTPAVTLNTDGIDCSATGGASDVEDLFQSGSVPTGYTLSNTLNCAALGPGGVGTCTITQTTTTDTGTANIICTN